MKTDDARKLMCPFQQHPEKTILCIANKCMAWSESEGGHCMLIEDIPGWLARIAYKLGV